MHNSAEVNTTWELFWKDNPTGFNETMAQSTLFFAKNLDEVLPIKPTDRFLDIGCGPGFLINDLRNKCEFIHGTDISEKYITGCKAKYVKNRNVSFSVSEAYDYETYQKLIVDHQINRVVLLSVLQYYTNENEVRNLLLALKAVAQQQQFSCLLADVIPTKHSTVSDIFSIVKHAVKRGYTLKFVKFLTYALFSDYRKIKKNGLLQIDESFFTSWAAELNVDIKIIKDLTLHTGRYSVLITF